MISDIEKRASEVAALKKVCLDFPNEAIRIVWVMDVSEGVKINLIENERGVDDTIILPGESGASKDLVLYEVLGGRDDVQMWVVYIRPY